MKKITLIITISVLLFSVYSCKKYTEGPSMSLRSKKARIEGNWKFESVMAGGIDSTSFSAMSGSEFTFGKDGSASGIIIQNSHGLGYIDTTTYDGRWELHEKNKAFVLIMTNNSTATIDTNWWWIRKLKNKEFWLEDEGNKGWDSQYIKLSQK